MELLVALQWAQAGLFVVLAAAGFRSWRRHRSPATAYGAGAFATLAAVTVVSRLADVVPGEPTELITDATIAVLVAFPWLLAAFAWSFTGPLPRWLRGAGIATALVAVAIFPLGPIGQVADRDGAPQLYVAVALTLWIALTTAAAAHLWLAGRGQRVVRARTRLLASGAVVLASVLLLAVTVDNAEHPALATTTAILTLVAAGLFASGFTPPSPLRWYWRQLPGKRMHEMQTALISAVTPAEVAEAVTPVVADVFGGGALCTDPAGRVVACPGLDEQATAAVLASLDADTGAADDVQVLTVDGWRLAVRTSPFAPLFGDDERDLLERYGLQLRLALQRAELYVAHAAAREQIERASTDQQAMLVGLSHDLRSPAVTISTYTSLLADARDDEDRDQMLSGLRDASGYLDRLVDGIASLSRIGRRDGEPEPVPLREVVTGVARRLAASHPDLDVRVDGPLPTLCTDRLRIEQVVDNLLGNAAKHAGRPDVTITLRWRPTVAGGVLTVADDGRGIAEHEREAVFTLFRRGTTEASGSGVGLGLVRRIVEADGGTVRFVPSDRGAVLELTLPADVLVADDAPDAASGGAPTRPPSRDAIGPRTT